MRISDWSSDVCSSDLDDRERDGYDDLQPLGRTDEELELTRVGDADARRQIDVACDRLLDIADQRLQVAVAAIDIDPGHRTAILAAQHRRPVADPHSCHRAERDLLARWREDRECLQLA